MTINLTKPAIEYTAQERREVFAETYRAVCRTLVPNCGRLSGCQRAWAKGRASKLMTDAGF